MGLICKITDEDIGEKIINMESPKLRLGARGIVIREDGKIAIFNKSNKNEYKLPGGGLEGEEKPEEAFKREVLEETGCEVEIIENLGTTEEYKSLNNFKQISYVFVGKVLRDTKQLNVTKKEKDEGAKLLWAKPLEALELIRKCIDNLKDSQYEDVYATKFVVLRDRRILEYYLKNIKNDMSLNIKESINEELVKYIENEVFPLYERNEEGHGIKHIKTVIGRSLKFAKDYNARLDMAYTVAAYHDLGHYIDRKRHEIISAEMFMKDEKIKQWFTDEQREIIKEAIEDHRASSNHEPRSIYGMIISTADRTIVDIDNSIKRSYSYGKRNYIGLSEEEQIERVFQHLTEKYGENGYAKIYLEDKEFDEAIKNLRQALSNKEEFIKRIKKVIS